MIMLFYYTLRQILLVSTLKSTISAKPAQQALRIKPAFFLWKQLTFNDDPIYETAKETQM